MEKTNLTGTDALEALKRAYQIKKLFETKYTFDPFLGFSGADPHELEMYKTCRAFLDSVENATREYLAAEEKF